MSTDVLATARQHLSNGNLQAAQLLLQQIIAAEKSLEALQLLGAIHFNARRYLDAADCWGQAVALDPDHAERRHLLGMALGRAGQRSAAIESLQAAIALDPDFVEARLELASTLYRAGEIPAAIAACRGCLDLDPTYPEAHLLLGSILGRNGSWSEAIEHLHAAVRYADTGENPGAILSGAHTNLAVHLFRHNRDAEAHPVFDQAIAAAPELAEARWNYALSLLRSGNYAAGFREYEWRWRTEQMMPHARSFPQPRWNGQPLDGQTLLLCSEQGLGDTIQFIRFARTIIEQKGGRVIVGARAALTPLLATVPGVSAVITEGDPLPHFDTWTFLMSVPPLLGISSPQEVPDRVPYVKVEPNLIATWQSFLGPRRSNRRVGLVWSGNELNTDDANRSMPLRALSPLFQSRDVEFFSLQVGPRGADALSFPIIDHTARLTDFTQTAALIQCLDLVISVDTAVAHLAGALAKPIWTLLPWCPDWRWGHGTDQNAWYPTMRLFRQPSPGAWQDVVGRVRDALTTFQA